jgi:hypothetical protein
MKIYSTASMACDSLHILSFLLLPLSLARLRRRVEKKEREEETAPATSISHIISYIFSR